MSTNINVQLGTSTASQILDAADRETNGEIDFLVKEEFFALKGEDVEVEDFLRALDKAAVIDAAVEEFRTKFTELFSEAVESYLEDEE